MNAIFVIYISLSLGGGIIYAYTTYRCLAEGRKGLALASGFVSALSFAIAGFVIMAMTIYNSGDVNA